MVVLEHSISSRSTYFVFSLSTTVSTQWYEAFTLHWSLGFLASLGNYKFTATMARRIEKTTSTKNIIKIILQRKSSPRHVT